MTTNFYPIEFSFDDYDVYRVEGTPEMLSELRAAYNETHSFFKHGEYIYISNKSGEDIGIGELVRLSVLDDYAVTSSLIKHIYFKTFLETHPGYKPNGFYPFIIQSLKKENDLIRKYLHSSLQGRISYVKQLELQLRRCNVNGKESFGFLVNVDRRWKIDINCKELNDKNYNLIDVEVIHSVIIPGLENILLPDESNIGIIQEVQGDNAVVITNEGEQTILLSELYIRKTTKNIKDFLSFALRSASKAENVLNSLHTEKHAAINPKSILKDIENACKVLFLDNNQRSVQYENKDGFCFNVNLSPEVTYKSYSLEPTLFVFDPARVRTDTWNDRGLRSYGPYDSSQFSPKDLQVLVICHKANRGKVAEFLKELIDGIPQSKYFTKGFKAKYELHNVNCDIQEVENFNIIDFQEVTRKLKYTPDIVIIELPIKLKEIKNVKESLYYLAKAHFLSLQIPIQIITSELISRYDEYKLNAIGLQMYSKLGGIPWTIQTKESVDREVIVGIGNSIYRDNAYAKSEKERIVGISTFFSGDGQYLMSGNIKDVPYDQYFDELLESINGSIETLAKEYGWRENDTVRLIFHIFKPIKNVEFEVVKKLIRTFTKYKVQFAFVTISEFHPWIMFDNSQTGLPRYGSVIGELIPVRGSNIVINNSSCLVQMLGPDEMKTGKHGASHPLLIKLLLPTNLDLEVDDNTDIKDLLFTDLHYISQQIFKLSSLSWRGFLPGQKPATMLYSSLISQLLAKLRKVPGWKSEIINFTLKFKKWFL